MKKRFSEAQIIGFLGEAEAGLPVKQLCRRHGFSEASYYLSVSNSLSGRHWELDQVPAVGDRTDIVQLGTGHPCVRRRRSTACGPSTTRACVPRCRRPDARGHATVPQSWMQRENWEFETHTLFCSSKAAHAVLSASPMFVAVF